MCIYVSIHTELSFFIAFNVMSMSMKKKNRGKGGLGMYV